MKKTVAIAMALSLVSFASAQAKTADDAAMDCMFSVEGTQYLSVSISNKNGQSSISYKKTKQARKDKVSKADLARIEANMSACINQKIGN